MTLNDIIVASLAQLNRGHDAKMLEAWRDKFTMFANDAIVDLAYACKLTKTEEVKLDGNILNTQNLSRNCMKVLSISRNGRSVPFSDGKNTFEIYTSETGVVSVTYRFVPKPLKNSNDVPELPEQLHGLIVCYVVGRERASGDVRTQNGGNVYFNMYEAGKAKIDMNLLTEYKFINRWS